MYRLITLPRSYCKIITHNLWTLIKKAELNYKFLYSRGKIPETLVENLFVVPKSILNIDQGYLKRLEHLSLVELNNTQALRTLRSSILFAENIFIINTSGIEPLHTLLENQPLILRSDEVDVGNTRKNILFNAKVIEEDYFVMPAENIPLK